MRKLQSLKNEICRPKIRQEKRFNYATVRVLFIGGSMLYSLGRHSSMTLWPIHNAHGDATLRYALPSVHTCTRRPCDATVPHDTARRRSYRQQSILYAK